MTHMGKSDRIYRLAMDAVTEALMDEDTHIGALALKNSPVMFSNACMILQCFVQSLNDGSLPWRSA